MFLGYIDLIPKISKVLLNGTAGVVGAHLFENFQFCGFRHVEIYESIFEKSDWDVFLSFVKVSLCLQK